MSQPRLVVLYPQKMFKQFSLEEGTVILGRGQEAGIKLDDDLVSRKHCAITYDGTQVTVQDLGSTNGTFVDGNPIQNFVLGEDNRLQVGSMVLKVEFNPVMEGNFDLKLYEASTLDNQTGVSNYRTFMNRSLGEIILARKNLYYLNIIMVEADHLESLGESLGSQSTEVILKEIARVLKDEKRDSDLLARYSDTKFVILMTGLGPEDGKRIAEKIRATIVHNHYSWKDRPIPVSVSVGLLSKQGENIATIQEMVTECKKLLETAQKSGGNQILCG